MQLKYMDDKNGATIRSWKKSHSVNWSESRVVNIVPNFFHRRLTGLELNSTWTAFLSEL